MCGRLTFWWLVPLLKLGYNVPLEQSDLSPLPGAEHVKAIEPSTGLHEVSQCPENAPTLWPAPFLMHGEIGTLALVVWFVGLAIEDPSRK